MSILKDSYQAIVANRIGTLFSVSADTEQNLSNRLGDILSNMTMEEGVPLQDGTEIREYKVKKVAGFVVKRQIVRTKQIA